jgi:hypothetical protein
VDFETIWAALERAAHLRALNAQVDHLVACPLHCLIAMWNSWDGETDVLGYAGEAIHAALNALGHGHICAV